MESGAITSIIILLLVLAFILIAIRWISLKRINQLLKPLQLLAEKNNGVVTDHDIWNHNIIGLDKNTSQVFFIKKLKKNKHSKS